MFLRDNPNKFLNCMLQIAKSFCHWWKREREKKKKKTVTEQRKNHFWQSLILISNVITHHHRGCHLYHLTTSCFASILDDVIVIAWFAWFLQSFLLFLIIYFSWYRFSSFHIFIFLPSLPFLPPKGTTSSRHERLDSEDSVSSAQPLLSPGKWPPSLTPGIRKTSVYHHRANCQTCTVTKVQKCCFPKKKNNFFGGS